MNFRKVMPCYDKHTLFKGAILLFLTEVVLLNKTEVDSRRPIWNVAHMVNALYQVDYYLDMGANSLEFDVAFSPQGKAVFTFHGIPCDCFRSCLRYETFDNFIRYLRRLTTPGDSLFREELVLLFMDMKISGLSTLGLINAGKDIANKLLHHYWQRGTSGAQAYVLVSVPSIKHMDFILSLRQTLEDQNATFLNDKIGYDFSGNENLQTISSILSDSGGAKDRIWIGDGITNCLPRSTSRLLEALLWRDDDVSYRSPTAENENPVSANKVYWWTVDKMSTMRRTLILGVDGMITNYPQSLKRVLEEEEFSSTVRLATIEDNPFDRHTPSPKITARAMHLFVEDEEEILYNS